MGSKKYTIALAVFGLLFWGGLSLPFQAFAETDLFISPATGTYRVGESFSVLINTNTDGRAINAASGQINFDNSRLEITSLGYTKSIFTIWVEEPGFSNAGGTIHFSGGVPNPGFTGSSGNILRITFKPKAIGSASVDFVSGTLLANDGQGTNILDNLKSGVFKIVAAPPTTPKPEEAPPTKPVPETAEKPLAPPIITNWPKQLEAGHILLIEGLAFPNSKVIVYAQRSSMDLITNSMELTTGEVLADADGRFFYIYKEPAKNGIYRIWAKNMTSDGKISGPSDTVSIETVAPLCFRIGTLTIDYAYIITTLLALLLLIIMIILWLWIKTRKRQKRQEIEIAEAKKALHQAFDAIKDWLPEYVRYLTQANTLQDIQKRGEDSISVIKKEMEEIEAGIEKEIEDMEKINRGD